MKLSPNTIKEYEVKTLDRALVKVVDTVRLQMKRYVSETSPNYFHHFISSKVCYHNLTIQLTFEILKYHQRPRVPAFPKPSFTVHLVNSEIAFRSSNGLDHQVPPKPY